MSLDKIHWRGKEAEMSWRIYIKKPEAIDSIKDIEYHNGRALEKIAEAEEYINDLKEYQQALYTRYQEICGTNYKLFLSLERRVNYDNSKKYVITIVKRFEGNNVADEEILRINYDGKKRHEALKRFEALKKEYPNIENEIDIAKKQWER